VEGRKASAVGWLFRDPRPTGGPANRLHRCRPDSNVNRIATEPAVPRRRQAPHHATLAVIVADREMLDAAIISDRDRTRLATDARGAPDSGRTVIVS